MWDPSILNINTEEDGKITFATLDSLDTHTICKELSSCIAVGKFLKVRNSKRMCIEGCVNVYSTDL